MTWDGPGVPADRVPPLAVFPQLGYGLFQPYGDFTPETIAGGGYELASHPGWRPGMDEVWDLRAVESLSFVKGDLLRFMELESHTSGHLAGSRTIIIAASNLEALGLGYMAKGYARVARMFSRQVYVVPDAESAIRDMAARGRAVGAFPTLPRDTGFRISEARTAALDRAAHGTERGTG